MRTYATNNNFPNIIALPQSEFDKYCYEHGINDENVENDKNSAFISIIGTKDCLKYYLDEEDTEHWFKENHENVLNLEFDDIAQDEIEWKGHTIKGFSDEQAKETVDFIENIINTGDKKNFIVHCRAGMSRSQAICAFLRYFYPEYFTANYSHLLPHYNKEVYRKLSRYFYKKHNMYE